MQYRNFGSSDLVTSAIGFGGWPMGRGHYGAFDEDEVVNAVHAAIDQGVTLFDTAAVYGWGEGEKLLGRALAGKRDQVVLVSKGGLTWEEPGATSGRDSSREHLTRGLEDSLRRLQTDYLDLYLIHWPDESRPFSEPMEAFAEFQRQGRIRYGGVSNFSADQMRESLETFPIVCDQVGYHLFDLRPEEETFPFCRERGVGVMAYGSLAHGLLTGTMTPDTEFAADDWRRNLTAFGQPLFQGETFLENLERVEDLKEIAAGQGRTVAQLALAWVLSNDVVSVALVGARRPAEIAENVLAADRTMSERERNEITSVVRARKIRPVWQASSASITPWLLVIVVCAAALISLAGCGSSNEAEEHYIKGVRLHDQGLLTEAIAEYDEAIRLDSGDPRAYNARGLAYISLGQAERALPDLDEAIRLDPDFAEAYNNRGFAYLSLRDAEKALPDLDLAIELDDVERPDAYHNRGFARLLLGEHLDAVEDFDVAIRLAPRRSESYRGRASAYRELGELEKAIEDVDEAIRLGPESAINYASRALTYTLLGDDEAASSDVEKALELGFDPARLQEEIEKRRERQ